MNKEKNHNNIHENGAESEKEIKKYGTKSLELNNLLEHKANWPQAYFSSNEACTSHGYWKTLREWRENQTNSLSVVNWKNV